MRRAIRFAVGPLLLMLPGAAVAQSSGPTSNIPVVASGQLPSSAPSASAPLTNVFQIGLTAGTHFDDNAILTAVPRQWDVGYTLSPDIRFSETLPRLDWGADYQPGIDISQRNLYRDYFSQKFDGHLLWLVSPHGALSAQEYYLVTTNPFAQLGAGAVSPGPTISPNQGLFIPNIRRTETLSNALYSYRFTDRTSFGIGGTFDYSKFDNTPKSGPATSLIFSQKSSGEAYLSHQFSARNSMGVQYGIQALSFPRENARTTTHTVLIFEQTNISPNSSFTIYGGPEYSDTSNQVQLNLGFVIITIPVKAQEWSGSGGVIYNWSGDRMGLTLNFTRGVSDGGALVGAVQATSGDARISWSLTRRWSLFSTMGGSSDQLLATGTQHELLTYSVSAGLNQQISRNVSMDWYYERLNQTGGFGNFPIGNHDFAGASLTYTFLKPVGR